MIQEPLDAPEIERKYERSLVLKIICTVLLVASLLQISGNFYATQIKGSGYENQWTIMLKVIPFVNIICIVGFWFLRRAAYFLFLINLIFTFWVDYRISGSFIDFINIINVFIAFVMIGELHVMKRYI